MIQPVSAAVIRIRVVEPCLRKALDLTGADVSRGPLAGLRAAVLDSGSRRRGPPEDATARGGPDVAVGREHVGSFGLDAGE